MFFAFFLFFFPCPVQLFVEHSVMWLYLLVVSSSSSGLFFDNIKVNYAVCNKKFAKLLEDLMCLLGREQTQEHGLRHSLNAASGSRLYWTGLVDVPYVTHPSHDLTVFNVHCSAYSGFPVAKLRCSVWSTEFLLLDWEKAHIFASANLMC